MKEINNFSKIKTKLTDKTEYFAKFISLKRLEKYANEIDTVLTKYNKKSCDETMMIKGLRKSFAETTNRKIHQEDLEKIVKQIAKGVGLNQEIIGIMGKHHDLGHTFLGHSGEWWISKIYEDDGIGTLCHNSIGARDLVYTKGIYKEIIRKIKVHNPDISDKELNKVKDSLWLIMDGINAHNGEKQDKEYVPDLTKTKKDFEKEILRCHVEPGFDRKITPATPEACAMRLADQISYVPQDMVDSLREGLIRDEKGNVVSTLDQDYIEILTKIGITREEIEKANETLNFDKIAERIKEIFIQDTIKNSTKTKIMMSKENMALMGKLRDLNNDKAVDNVILKEDQEIYPPAIRELQEKYARIYQNIKNSSEEVEYSEEDERFIRFTQSLSYEDLKFTGKIISDSLIESTKQELAIARDCVLNQKEYKDKEEKGLDYNHKNARIKGYISYYLDKLSKGEMINYSEKQEKREISKIVEKVKLAEAPKNYLSLEERLAKNIAGQYISSLSDNEFLNLLLKEKLISEEQKISLTRKYLNIKDLKSEVYIQSTWKDISKAQKEATKKADDENSK